LFEDIMYGMVWYGIAAWTLGLFACL